VHHLSDNFNSITSVPGNGVSGHAVLGDASVPADASVSALPHYGWLWKKVICVCVREREKEKGGKRQGRKFDNVNSFSLVFFPSLIYLCSVCSEEMDQLSCYILLPSSFLFVFSFCFSWLVQNKGAIGVSSSDWRQKLCFIHKGLLSYMSERSSSPKDICDLATLIRCVFIYIYVYIYICTYMYGYMRMYIVLMHMYI